MRCSSGSLAPKPVDLKGFLSSSLLLRPLEGVEKQIKFKMSGASKSPINILCIKVSKPNSKHRTLYEGRGIWFDQGRRWNITRVIFFWFFSILSMYVIWWGHQTTLANSRMGRTKEQYNVFKLKGSLKSAETRKTNPNSLRALVTIVW